MTIKKEQTKKDIGEEKEDREDRDFSDDFDIINDVTAVHDQKEFGLNKNFVLMRGGQDKLTDFIAAQHMVAIKSYNLLPDEQYARKAYNLITAELDDRAIMTRNVRGNMILTGVLARGMDPALQGQLAGPPEKQGIIKKTTNKIKSLIGKGPKVKPEDEVIIG